MDLEIVESLKQLKNALKHSRQASSKERLQMLYWLKSGQVTSRKEIAQRLGRDVATITRWLRKYREGGLKELLSVKKAPGKKLMLNPENLEKLKQKLSEAQGFQSYGEIQKWCWNELGIKMAYTTGHQIVRYKLGSPTQSPQTKKP